ncbi:hypothetical protein [Herpetosiphon giganteus]|uniref:hypothetical protein n=1 Tax=Herpetosiphon giganteus TaxID=2029754 RepID=UPI001957296E|nr:hypothetical protein [Herpetosiphon giganteus]MBM7842328.1 hypothetical protein [Herpetosiphon giganteus]
MQQQACPQCQRQLALNAAYLPWCECGWNIKPHSLPESYGMFEQIYTNVSKRLGKQMLHQMRSLNDLQPRMALITRELLGYEAQVMQRLRSQWIKQ